MSDRWIILIPRDPHFIPDESSQEAAVAKFAEIAPRVLGIEAVNYDPVAFVDCGRDFETVWCPACGAQLYMDWWEETMESDFSEENGFQLKEYPTPCCGEPATLNALSYEWPQGFARFALKALDPDHDYLSGEEIEEFESILKTPLMQILRCD